MIKVEGVYVKGIACCVPKRVADNLDVPSFDESKKERIVQTTGVRYRRVASDNMCTSDFTLQAAKALINTLDIDVSEIGILIFASQTPDYVLPATSHFIHKELKLATDVITFDVNLGCSAYVYAMYVASALLKTIPQKYALLLVGDTISKYASPEDPSTTFLFGDAGSATILESKEKSGEMLFSLGSDGNGWENLIIPAGASRIRHSVQSQQIVEDSEGNRRSQEQLYMDGMEIFNFTISTVVPHIQQVVDSCGMPDIVVFHQANKYMLEFMRKSLSIPKSIFKYSLPNFGNTSSASIPLTLCADAKGRENGSSALLSGFGVGYSWGTAVVDLSNTTILDILEASELDEQSKR